MATSKEYLDFVLDQLHDYSGLRYRKMFGEYMVYQNDKPILLLCDDTVFVKKLPELESLMDCAATGYPYANAKEYYILDIEDPELCESVIEILERLTPVPQKKVRKQK